MANTKITLEDEFGTHEFESDADCIIICDDGNGNVTFSEGDCDDEDDFHDCDNCGRCVGLSYCVLEEDDYYEEEF